MTINRMLWKVPFRKSKIPMWPCPHCETGFLQLQSDTFKLELLAGYGSTDPEELDPTQYKSTFVAMFECSNKTCKQHVASCGLGEVVEERYGDTEIEYEELFFPEYFLPPLAIFSIPWTCPEPIAGEIWSSFRLFFCDPPAAANHIRKAVEYILTDKGVKRFQGSNGKRTYVSLHQRIRLYEAKDKDVAERLFAIKWLGNTGSHTGELRKDDVLDAFEILETVLDDLYVGHGKSLKKKITLVNKRKGPLKRRVR